VLQFTHCAKCVASKATGHSRTCERLCRAVRCAVLCCGREMPTRATLLAAGRADLVNLISKVGGFSQVRKEALSNNSSRLDVSLGLCVSRASGALSSFVCSDCDSVCAHLQCPGASVLLQQAALQLGLRATRRPAGYWDSLEVLDLELDALIAGTASVHLCICVSLHKAVVVHN
jgi:hypothetical protein